MDNLSAKNLSRLLLTAPLSWLYRLAVKSRHYLYDCKWLAKKFAPLPVISIGNVVTGGVGKTQVALFLAHELSHQAKVAILSRGYKGKAEHAKHPLVVDVRMHSASLSGDEPWLLADRFKQGVVIVNKDRFKSALEAKKLGAQLLVLDDGMQHRKLHRDYEIVVLDAQNPFGEGSFLPRGNLREDLKQLYRADLIFFMGSPSKKVEAEVASFTSAPKVIAHTVVEGVQKLDGTAVGSLKGEAVAVFCGIGNPHRFVRSVEGLGARVVASFFAPDHQGMKKEELYKFADLSKKRGAKLLLCTEKDKVKFSSIPEDLPLPIGWVKASLEVVGNREIWDQVVANVKQLAGITV